MPPPVPPSVPAAVQTHPMKLVTIVAESAVEHRLTDDLLHLGATGFTVVEGRGEGTRHARRSEYPGANVRVEVVVTPAAADRILAHLAERYFPSYSIVAYVGDVQVVRSAKYDATQRALQTYGEPHADR